MSQSFDQNSAVYRCSYSGWLFVRDWKKKKYIYINVLFRLSFLPKGFSFVSWSAWKISANPLSPLISPAVYKDCPLSMLTAGVLTSYTGNIQTTKCPPWLCRTFHWSAEVMLGKLYLRSACTVNPENILKVQKVDIILKPRSQMSLH